MSKLAGEECQRSRDLALFPGTTFYVQHLGPKPARLRTGNKSPGSDPVALFLGRSSYFIVVLRCYSPVKDSIKCYSTWAALTMRVVRAVDCDTGKEIIEDARFRRLRETAAEDQQYCSLVQTVSKGFPKKPDLLSSEVRPYWNIRDELTVDDGIVLWGARMIIPASLRKEVLQQLHASHQGQERTLRRARQIVYWPNISNDIRNIVRSCKACAEHLPSLQAEPLQQEVQPSRPFESVSGDLFHVAGKTFLLLVDRFSGWPIVADCGRSSTMAVVVRLMKDAFTDKGVPTKLVTDGGLQFSSREFSNFVTVGESIMNRVARITPRQMGLQRHLWSLWSILLRRVAKAVTSVSTHSERLLSSFVIHHVNTAWAQLN